jgi:hypothetical protein
MGGKKTSRCGPAVSERLEPEEEKATRSVVAVVSFNNPSGLVDFTVDYRFKRRRASAILSSPPKIAAIEHTRY